MVEPVRGRLIRWGELHREKLWWCGCQRGERLEPSRERGVGGKERGEGAFVAKPLLSSILGKGELSPLSVAPSCKALSALPSPVSETPCLSNSASSLSELLLTSPALSGSLISQAQASLRQMFSVSRECSASRTLARLRERNAFNARTNDSGLASTSTTTPATAPTLPRDVSHHLHLLFQAIDVPVTLPPPNRSPRLSSQKSKTAACEGSELKNVRSFFRTRWDSSM